MAVHAPYNFIPFSSKLLLPYADETQLPPHDRICQELKTGEIRIRLTADTPVFVSNGSKENPHFFRNADGKYAIAGSSVRGLIRENMQILGFGLIRPGEDLDDYQIYYREMAAARNAVAYPVRENYVSVLHIENRRSPDGQTYSVPENVKAGYLYHEGAKFFIRPLPESNALLRVSRDFAEKQGFGRGNARVVPVAFSAHGDKVQKIVRADKAEAGMRSGRLLFTGPPVGRIPNKVYLFPMPDLDADIVPLSDADILAYRVDLESRQNSLKGLRKHKREDANRDERDWLRFWALPEDGDSKPVFYLTHNGRCYFGMSRFLRIGYPHSIAEGLPPVHKEKANVDNCPLDYAHALFGFAEKSRSYRSRVSVGDFVADGDPNELPPLQMILGEPRPSYYPGYLLNGKSYVDDDFQLRGYKQYWLKESQATEVPDDKEKVGTSLALLPKGTQFVGVIRFKNLTREELGLLLWCLRLEDGCFQSIGKGKPYGYGRIKLKIEDLRLISPERLYGPDCSASPWDIETEQIAAYISAYDMDAAQKLYIKQPKKRPSITSRPEIKDFFFMKSTIRNGSEVDYMTLEEYQKERSALPELRTERERLVQADATSQPDSSWPKEKSMEELLAELRNKNKPL